ncbi:MAG TPA: hypothetical protein P5307_06390, partial [Pirellulaceae bacterium]|nr:hypothetical protein [Pirellulaceae bacterium]
DHAIVTDIDAGRIRQIVQSPIANTAIEAVRFSSSGDMISLLSSYGSQVEIRSRQGKLLHRWEADTQYALGNHLWFPNEQRLLLANASKLTVFDLQGTKLAELSFDRPLAAPPSIGILQARQSVLWMSDGILHEWDTASQESQVLVTSPNWKEGSRGGFKVSPSGNRILTWDSNSQTNIWDSEGKLILGRELSLNTAAWSPDDRYIVDGNLTIYNAENLERVNQLALPPDDVLRGNSFEPHWVREGEITFMCQSYGLTTLAGAVRKFHPSGRQLAAAEWPQPLAPASATFNAQGLLTAVHAANVTDCALSIWNADGTANDYVKLAQSLLVNSTEVCWNSRTQQILMRDVNGVGRIFDMQGNEVRTLAGLRIGNPMWSPADDRFAVIRYAEQSGQILLFSDGDEPIWTSPAFVPFIPPPTWSPDGRWLAWVTHEPATDKHRLHVLDVADEAKTVHEFSLIEQGVDRCISISPDSQWLVTIRQDPREPQARGEVLALHLPTLKEYRQLVSVNGLLARKVVWEDDSQTFAAGAVMRVSPQKGLERLGSLSLSGLPESFVQLQSGKLLSCQDGIGKQYTFDGESNAEFGITTPALSGHADPYQANLTSGSRVVFMAAGRVSQKQTTVGEFDRSLPAVRWTGIAFDDGQRLSFNAAGALLSAPEDYDRYLAHSLRYPGGRTVAVTREELHRRIAATPTEKALLWAMDLFADMRDDNSATWSLADPIDVDALPAIDSIRYLDLHDAKEIADQELSYLPQFNGLSQLNLSDTEISMLPDLSSLKGLQALDLSGTKLQSIDGLQGLSALKQLDLSRTEISLTEESIEILASLSALEQLNLNDARTQAFVPLRLAGLKNLRQLSLIGVDLPADELRQLQQDLPECEFLIDEKDRGRSQLSNTAD